MPKSRKKKHSDKPVRKGSSGISKKHDQTFDCYTFFTDVLQLKDEHSFPERDSWACTFLRNNRASSSQPRDGQNKEKEARSFLASRYPWLKVSDWCPAVNIVDIKQCRDLLDEIAWNTKHLKILGGIAQNLKYTMPSRWSEHNEGVSNFPEEIRSRLQDIETSQSFIAALTHFSFSKAILHLEGFLVTCLSIPVLRPFLQPLAESKIVHVLSKMLDCLLGLESLERSIPEISHLHTSPELDASAVEITDICTQALLNFIAECGVYTNGRFDPFSTVQEIQASTSEFVKYFRLMVGAGPTTKEMDDGFRAYSDALNKECGTAAYHSVWLYEKRHNYRARPLWGNLQDVQQLQTFLKLSPSVCDCSASSALATCNACLTQLHSVLESFLDRAAICHHMLRDTANIFEEMLRSLQANTTSDLCEQKECLLYQEMMERIKGTTEHRLTVFLLSHLLRMARLTSNFTRSIRSPDARLYFMDILCKSIYRFQLFQRASANPFGDNVMKRTASALLRNIMLKPVEDDTLLLKTLEGYIRQEGIAVKQLLAKTTRANDAEIAEKIVQSASAEAFIAQLMDEMLIVADIACKTA